MLLVLIGVASALVPLAHGPAVQAAAPHARVSIRMMSFSFDAFERDVFRSLMKSQEEARAVDAKAVDTGHVLVAAATQGDAVSEALERPGVSGASARQAIKNSATFNPTSLFKLAAGNELLPFAKDTEMALKASARDGTADELVSWRELVRAIVSDEAEASGGSEALRILQTLGCSRQTVYEQLGARELVAAGAPAAKKATNTTLDQCAIDLTERARAGKLDPLVGRESEMRNCLQVLSRRRKNNPVLIGDPGVGKTAIAEGLAQLIVDRKVPPKLANARLLSLELGRLVADTRYRGEFEQKLREVIDEVSSPHGSMNPFALIAPN